MQIGDALQRCLLVGANRSLATQGAGCCAGKASNKGTRHLEVVRVVRQDTLQVMRVPGPDPCLGETRCLFSGHHKFTTYHAVRLGQDADDAEVSL